MAPDLSVVIVASTCRARAQAVLDSLERQTAADSIETVVVDVSDDGAPALRMPDAESGRYLRLPGCRRYGRARAEGARHATAPAVAFLEDHCYPEPGWAQALIEAHQGAWGSVGYTFINANPGGYVSRSSMIADYGRWLSPSPSGPARWLAGSNVSYKREPLLAFGEALDTLLDVDFAVHELMKQRGLELFLEGGAVTAHENWTGISGAVRSNHNYARLMAAHRAESQRWGATRKLVYGVGAALLSAPVRLARTVGALRARRRVLLQLAAGLPVVLAVHQGAAVGEALGYLRGAGPAASRFTKWELEVERVPRPA